MKREGNLMPQICTYENALSAYNKARQCKRYRIEVLKYEHNREENLLRAVDELKNLSYVPGDYRVFEVYEPKKRLIMALPFHDRVVHHMIVSKIEPVFERKFIHHSYACRKGKGEHAASDQLSRWLYNEEVLNGKRIYALKGDIYHYFQSIDHDILKREVRRSIKDKNLLVLTDRIIDHNGSFPDGVGIPVGNLTSQLYANVYLNKLDMFVKTELHVDKYMRYMDDFILLSDDIDELRYWLGEIDIFVNGQLNLRLNKNTTIVCAKNGVDFVGYRHWNSTKKVRKGAIRRMRILLKDYKNGNVSEEFVEKSFQSRIGGMQHADTYHLIEKYKEELRLIKQCRETA